MEITGIQGSGAAGYVPKPTTTAAPGAATGPNNTTPSGQPTTTAVSASSQASSSILFDSNSRPVTGNLALAFMILSMLLEGSKDGNEESNQFALGLAAGLLAAEQNQPRTMFYSSSHSQTSAEAVIGPRDVEASYMQNMELPAVAADPASPTPDASGTTEPVAKINTQA